MAEQDLLALVKRLEAVALKLESSAGAGGAGKSLLFYVWVMESSGQYTQWSTEGRRSTTVAEDLLHSATTAEGL